MDGVGEDELAGRSDGRAGEPSRFDFDVTDGAEDGGVDDGGAGEGDAGIGGTGGRVAGDGDAGDDGVGDRVAGDGDTEGGGAGDGDAEGGGAEDDGARDDGAAITASTAGGGCAAAATASGIATTVGSDEPWTVASLRGAAAMPPPGSCSLPVTASATAITTAAAAMEPATTSLVCRLRGGTGTAIELVAPPRVVIGECVGVGVGVAAGAGVAAGTPPDGNGSIGELTVGMASRSICSARASAVGGRYAGSFCSSVSTSPS